MRSSQPSGRACNSHRESRSTWPLQITELVRGSSNFCFLIFICCITAPRRSGGNGTGKQEQDHGQGQGQGQEQGRLILRCIWDANPSFSPWLVRISASAALLGVLCNIPGCIISLAEMSTVDDVDDSVNVGSTLQRVSPGIGILLSFSKTLKIRDGKCLNLHHSSHPPQTHTHHLNHALFIRSTQTLPAPTPSPAPPTPKPSLHIREVKIHQICLPDQMETDVTTPLPSQKAPHPLASHPF